MWTRNTTHQLRRPLVLIVAPNKDQRTLMRINLQSEPYDILESNSGLEALELVKEREVDLVIMDVGMPKMSGILTGRQLRGIQRKIKIIYISNAFTHRMYRGSAHANSDTFLRQPFRQYELIEKVRQQLEDSPTLEKHLV